MKHFEMPLDIEDVEIERVEFKENGEIIITVTSTLEGTYCHRCGQEITDSYGCDREITLRHLSILGRPTFLQIRPALLRSLGPLRGPCFRRCFDKFSRRYMRMSSKLCFLHWRFFRASWMFLILFQINMGGNVK